MKCDFNIFVLMSDGVVCLFEAFENGAKICSNASTSNGIILLSFS